MPGISDPGERLVAAVAEAGLDVTTGRGWSQLLLRSSPGPPQWPFRLRRVLARKGQERAAQLSAIAAERRTTVLMNRPTVWRRRWPRWLRRGPDRRAVVARELTKLHEELRRGTR